MTPVNWGLYDACVLAKGNTAKDRQISNFKNNMTRYGVNSLSNKDIKIDGVSQKLFITDTKDPYVKNFQDINEVIYSAGTIVEYVGKYWLVETMSFDGELYKTGQLRYCNYNLRFLSSLHQPVSRFCYVSRTRSGTDTNGTPIKMELPTGQLAITLPLDSDTSLLDRTYDDGRNQRLLVDFGTDKPRAYQIKDADRFLPGIVQLTLVECERSDDDNVELMIADYDRYTAPESSTIPVAGKCEIIYSGEPVISVGLAPKKFTAKFYDSEGDVIDVTPVWTITMTDHTLESKVISTLVGDDIYLQVKDVSLIGETIRLDLSDADETMTDYVMIGVKSIGR